MCLHRICLSARQIPKSFTNNFWGIYNLSTQQVNGHHSLHTCNQKKKKIKIKIRKNPLNENNLLTLASSTETPPRIFANCLSVQLPQWLPQRNSTLISAFMVQERIPRNRLDAYKSCASDFIGTVKPSHRLLLYSRHPWAAFRLRQMDIPLMASVILHTRRIQSESDTGHMMGWYPCSKLQLSCSQL